MGLTDGSRYFNFPSYTTAELTTRNPLLLKGERVYELHPSTGLPWRAKIGPGLWNALSYEEDDYFSSTPPTNIIGDAFGNLQYLPLRTILERMLNPFRVPIFSAPLINVNSLGYVQTRQLEVGQTISSPVLMNATVDVPGNLAAGSPYNITAGGFFTNEGNFASLPASLSRTPLVTTTLLEIVMSLKGAYTGGQGGFTNTVQGFLNVYPKMIWGTSALSSLTPTDWATLLGRQTLISKVFKNDYPFITLGYFYLAIPSMLSPGTLIFTDVTDPNFPGPISFQYQGIQSINNGVGTYNYATYRSIYSMTATFIVRVR